MKRNSLGTDDAGVAVGQVRVGCIVGSTERGEPLVDYPDNEGEPIAARVVASARSEWRAHDGAATEVLLVFAGGDPARPIIVGVLESPQPCDGTLASGVIRRDRRDNVTVDGRTLELAGRERVLLTCGKSSIELHADGRVIIKGTRLLSRASESNRIKGATIALN